MSGINDLYQTVAAYCRQSPSFFTRNGQDLLLQAINSCFNYADQNDSWMEKQIVGKVAVHYQKGGDLSKNLYHANNPLVLTGVSFGTGSNIVTCDSTVGLVIGDLVEGPGLNWDTLVLGITDSTDFTLTQNPLEASISGQTLDTFHNVNMKQLDCVYFCSHFPFQWVKHALVPVELETKKTIGIWIKERIRKTPRFTWDWRYPSDAYAMVARRMTRAYVHGDRIHFDPPFGPPAFPEGWMHAIIDCEEAFPTFTATDLSNNTQNFLITKGWEFLLFRTLDILNPFTLQFIPRTEGFLPPPTQQWTAAWNALVTDNEYKYTEAMLGNHQH